MASVLFLGKIILQNTVRIDRIFFMSVISPLAKVCVAFQYASVVGGLLIMLFSAFVCTGGQSQAMLIAVYGVSSRYAIRIPAHWLLLLQNRGPLLSWWPVSNEKQVGCCTVYW